MPATSIETPKPPPDLRSVPCECCGAPALFLDSVDFNKSCEEAYGHYLLKSGKMVDYFLCDACGFGFAPEFREWTRARFSDEIYNEAYVDVDPEYVSKRPTDNANALQQRFGAQKEHIRHLDYGGGSGVLSRVLRENGWDSQSYDPMVDPEKDIADLGTFNFVTAFEVFEHVPDINALVAGLIELCTPDGLIMFSTYCSDGEIQRGQPLTWWYAAPRNGHISLFSQSSLRLMFSRYGFIAHSIDANLHLAFRSLPEWSGYSFA